MTDESTTDEIAYDQISLRHGVSDDLEALTRIYNHYIRHSVSTFDTRPFQAEARRGWFAHFASGSPHQLWVAERRGALLGYASSSAFRSKPAYDTSVETSVYLHPDHQGKGLGKLLYTKLFERLSVFPLRRAFAGIALPNPGSIALHEAIGFERVGTMTEAGYKFGGYHDLAWYEKPL